MIEARTLLQVFVDQVDLFGKPGKKFYESLISYTKDETVLKEIIGLISPAGEDELKKIQDVDFLTYADVLLQKFNTVKPPVLDLLTLIPSLKRREYSIASSKGSSYKDSLIDCCCFLERFPRQIEIRSSL